MAERLIERWSAPDRHFHNVRHLIDTLARVDALAAETQHPDLVRLATWFHGVVFSTTGLRAYTQSAGEDKEASAQIALECLEELGIDAEVRERVADMILALKRHHPDKCDIDQQVLCDADLGTVATSPQKYRAYREAVRREFAHLPVRQYLTARIAVVTSLLERRTIFHSPLARDWEEPARENLTAELARLEKELADLGEPVEQVPNSPREDTTSSTGSSTDLNANSDPKVARVPLAERRGRVRAGLDDSHTATITRVAPARPLRALDPDHDADHATPFGVPELTDATGIVWDEDVSLQNPDGLDAPANFYPSDAVMVGEDVDERSSLETGPEALFASLNALAERQASEAGADALPKLKPNVSGATIRGLAAASYANTAKGEVTAESVAAENIAAANAANRNSAGVYSTFESSEADAEETTSLESGSPEYEATEFESPELTPVRDEKSEVVPEALSGIEREPNLETRLRRQRR